MTVRRCSLPRHFVEAGGEVTNDSEMHGELVFVSLDATERDCFPGRIGERDTRHRQLRRLGVPKAQHRRKHAEPRIGGGLTLGQMRVRIRGSWSTGKNTENAEDRPAATPLATAQESQGAHG